MIRSAILCPDSDLYEQLVRVLAEVHAVYVARRLESYPDELELGRCLQATGSDLLFVSTETPARALAVAQAVSKLDNRPEIVALARQQNEDLLRLLMQGGVRHILVAPFDKESVAEVVEATARRLEEGQRPARGGRFYSFLPAKPGAGTTTLAINTARALARGAGRRTLLMDFDLNLGAIGFLLRLPSTGGVVDAASDAMEPDADLWLRNISSVDGIHVLPSSGSDSRIRLHMTQVRHLLDFVRRMYTDVCIDMSGNLEGYSIETLQESQRIALVTSLDPVAAHLAIQKLSLLERLELLDRVLIVATRPAGREWLSVDELESLLGRNVDVTVPHDHAAVWDATEARETVDPGSSVGRHCAKIAQLMAKPASAGILAGVKRSFLEHFSLPR